MAVCGWNEHKMSPSLWESSSTQMPLAEEEREWRIDVTFFFLSVFLHLPVLEHCFTEKFSPPWWGFTRKFSHTTYHTYQFFICFFKVGSNLESDFTSLSSNPMFLVLLVKRWWKTKCHIFLVSFSDINFHIFTWKF